MQGKANVRMERDSMGDVSVPAEAYYGAQTMRAIQNFPVSGLRMPRAVIRALGRIKGAAARVNTELGLLDPLSPRRSSEPPRRWRMARWTPTSRSMSSRPAPAPRRT